MLAVLVFPLLFVVLGIYRPVVLPGITVQELFLEHHSLVVADGAVPCMTSHFVNTAYRTKQQQCRMMRRRAGYPGFKIHWTPPQGPLLHASCGNFA